MSLTEHMMLKLEILEFLSNVLEDLKIFQTLKINSNIFTYLKKMVKLLEWLKPE